MALRSRADEARYVVGLAVVMLLVACGNDVDEAASSTTTPTATLATPDTVTDRATTTTRVVSTDTTTTTATTTTVAIAELTTTTLAVVPDDEATEVIEAYLAHWPIFDASLNGNPPGDPADYFTGARLADLSASVAEFAEKGLEIQGEAIYAPGEVSVRGDEAFFTDCQLDLTFAVSRTTGETVIPASTEAQAVAVEMVRSDGVWKVSSVIFEVEGTCVQ